MKAQQLALNSLPINMLTMEAKTNNFQFVVIDDDTINNMVCKAAIKAATGGMTASCFNNPVEALSYFENEFGTVQKAGVTVVLLDINMPEMNGWEWLEKYSMLPQKVKEHVIIYILSSSVNPTDIDHARSNDLVKDYLIKPLSKAKVLNLIEETNSTGIAQLNKILT